MSFISADRTRPRNLQRRARLEESHDFYSAVTKDLAKVANVTTWHTKQEKKGKLGEAAKKGIQVSQSSKYASFDAKRRNIAGLESRMQKLREKLDREMEEYERELHAMGLTFEELRD
mmetsp:Transcript_414/g.1574  ORF Transcript_414/g.1574 Transcript_414/m.1574 type:complete len:117 (-) Transcript_414:138-488(-)|eukprot:CAMPEP_0117444092 /NCGR_PEP_ID=MMETSP0759-20121206/5050_1 /TAXON_ID=63605 /ORGANISM="Percolomonas cosmopolitus, Strain WS" /LENGTH=116 /DNA_ID=CAMNT_0005236123 /DNA_START=122 /DNA_END=472 /DNA_ORIENTATION=+